MEFCVSLLENLAVVVIVVVVVVVVLKNKKIMFFSVLRLTSQPTSQ
jgi:hypothetical protein